MPGKGLAPVFSMHTHSRQFWIARVYASVVMLLTVIAIFSSTSMAHEIDQRLGRYSSSDGESRVMAKFTGRADAPAFAGGDGQVSLSLSAQSETIKNSDKYMQTHFDEGIRREASFGVDLLTTVAKRSEVSLGGSVAGDTVTKSKSVRASLGQWFIGDQLRVGVAGSKSVTERPVDSFLDYDSATVALTPRVVSSSGSLNLKAILNPRTIASGDYTVVSSSERPLLRSWSVGLKQFIDPCDCAVHGEAARVINLGKLDTTMSVGELTGTQFTVAYLQSLWKNAHSRLSYRYAREDEFTRAYGDHLVFGADSYVAGLSQELDNVTVAGASRPILLDVAATRYIHNQAGAATTVELGGSVKF